MRNFTRFFAIVCFNSSKFVVDVCSLILIDRFDGFIDGILPQTSLFGNRLRSKPRYSTVSREVFGGILPTKRLVAVRFAENLLRLHCEICPCRLVCNALWELYFSCFHVLLRRQFNTLAFRLDCRSG